MESMCSGSAEPSIRLAYVLAGQLLKFCGHAICYNAPTLNNSQNLNLDFLAASFWVQWARAHGRAGKCLISGGNKDLCKLGKEYSDASICKFVVYSLEHSETFDVSHVFLPITTAELSMLKQVWFFGPPCTIRTVINTQSSGHFYGPPSISWSGRDIENGKKTLSTAIPGGSAKNLVNFGPLTKKVISAHVDSP